MKLTQKDVDRLGPGEYRDDEVPGLVLRVRATGHRAFALRYTLPATGVRKRLKLGKPTAAFRLEHARIEALKRLGHMHVGVDPAKNTRPSDGPTVLDVVNRYLAEAQLSPATIKEFRRLADVELAPIATRAAKDLGRSDIRALGATIRLRSGYVANRTFGLLRAAWSWAVAEADILESTPFYRLKPPFSGERRSKRVLSADELRALVFALDELRRPEREITYRDSQTGECRTKTEVGGDHYADALLILLLTGVRRRAVIEARTAELLALETADEEANAAEWRVSPDHLKMRERDRANADPHVVPLSRQAAAVFRHRVRAVAGSQHLFPRARAARSRGREAATWSSRWVDKLRSRMAELAGGPVPPWKVHNLRHTLATHIENELKVAETVTAGILGHSRGRGVTSRYALAQHLVARREALQAWADWLDSLRRSSFRVASGQA